MTLADVPIAMIWEELDRGTWCVVVDERGVNLYRSGPGILWMIRDEIIIVFRQALAAALRGSCPA